MVHYTAVVLSAFAVDALLDAVHDIAALHGSSLA